MPATLPRQRTIAIAVIAGQNTDDPLAVIDTYGQRIEVPLPLLRANTSYSSRLKFEANVLADGTFVVCGANSGDDVYRAIISPSGVLLSEMTLGFVSSYRTAYVDRYGKIHILNDEAPARYMAAALNETSLTIVRYLPDGLWWLVKYGGGGVAWCSDSNYQEMFWHINGAEGSIDFGAGMQFSVLGGVIEVFANENSGPRTFRTITNPSAVLFTETTAFNKQMISVAHNELYTVIGKKSFDDTSSKMPLDACHLINHISGTYTTQDVSQWNGLRSYINRHIQFSIASQGNDELFVMSEKNMH